MRSIVAKPRSGVGHAKLHCSFCGGDESRVARLVAGASAHICHSCIIECVAVLDRQDKLAKNSGFDTPSPTQPH